MKGLQSYYLKGAQGMDDGGYLGVILKERAAKNGNEEHA